MNILHEENFNIFIKQEEFLASNQREENCFTNEQMIETLDEKLDRIIKQEYGNRFWENGKIVFSENQNGQVSKSTTEVSKTGDEKACSGVDQQPECSEFIKKNPKKLCHPLADQHYSVSTKKNRKSKTYEKPAYSQSGNQFSNTSTLKSRQTRGKHLWSPSHKISDNRCKHSNKDSWKCTTNFVKNCLLHHLIYKDTVVYILVKNRSNVKLVENCLLHHIIYKDTAVYLSLIHI